MQKENDSWVVGSRLVVTVVTLFILLLTTSIGATVTAMLWRSELQTKVVQLDSRLSHIEEWRNFITNKEIPERLATMQESLSSICEELARLRQDVARNAEEQD